MPGRIDWPHLRVLLASGLGLILSLSGCSESTSPDPIPAQLAFRVQPTNTTAGATIVAEVAVQDARGNTVTSATTSVTLAIEANPGGGTLVGATTVAAADGVATFANLSIDQAGAGYTLTASAKELAGGNSVAFNVVPLIAVSTGHSHTCGLTTGGAAYCWGQNWDGALGNDAVSPSEGSSTPVAVSGGLTFAAVSAGFVHTCGVTTGGAAYCWGSNSDGQAGNRSLTSSSIPVPVSGP